MFMRMYTREHGITAGTVLYLLLHLPLFTPNCHCDFVDGTVQAVLSNKLQILQRRF